LKTPLRFGVDIVPPDAVHAPRIRKPVRADPQAGPQVANGRRLGRAADRARQNVIQLAS